MKDVGYLLESLSGLREIMTRLYDDKPLNGDERRDLANKMHAILEGATPLKQDGFGQSQAPAAGSSAARVV